MEDMSASARLVSIIDAIEFGKKRKRFAGRFKIDNRVYSSQNSL
ncbi:MAG: hypothetical protein ETSY2_01235 [Candidatus Entotheonella gemina]|uniref:Uncharacterized protein n=1 Tax=Candidatus Entotheonella gemina TaxID=1429439 RepID=W4MG09_9BACT|nr:MAG: hypothetical protein ETSY2_01235 [Candidatus Entotheonella gemina]